jgi:DtxR family Mn-dependent transcriptional regulator
MENVLSKSDRETLKAIYRLTRGSGHGRGSTGGRASAPVVEAAHTGALAEALGVTPGTATTAVKRLAERGFLTHKPYRGVELTRAGRRAAVAAIRRHRIVERFLADMLGYAWNEADRFAGDFEHELPQQVEDRLYVALDRPTTCPHGFPIPDPDVIDIPDMPPLYALEPGETAIVAVPGSTDPEIVTFLDTLGLRPGIRVRVQEKHPFDGPLVLRVDGSDRTISEKVARQIYVRKEERSNKKKGDKSA